MYGEILRQELDLRPIIVDEEDSHDPDRHLAISPFSYPKFPTFGASPRKHKEMLCTMLAQA
jgi:hypothetical protein